MVKRAGCTKDVNISHQYQSVKFMISQKCRIKQLIFFTSTCDNKR